MREVLLKLQFRSYLANLVLSWPESIGFNDSSLFPDGRKFEKFPLSTIWIKSLSIWFFYFFLFRKVCFKNNEISPFMIFMARTSFDYSFKCGHKLFIVFIFRFFFIFNYITIKSFICVHWIMFTHWPMDKLDSKTNKENTTHSYIANNTNNDIPKLWLM